MYRALIDRLASGGNLTAVEYLTLIENRAEIREYAAEYARRICNKYYQRDVYIRGLIEFTNICGNDCYYCGIRRSNGKAERYRLTEEQILACCKQGYALGFRTFVLQGGEDAYYTDDILCGIIKRIKRLYPDCAITLSVGERSRSSYVKLKQAGADRYLLRHETANKEHYGKLHPPSMSYENRMQCLKDLKSIGFQTGAGFMVGSPGQTNYDLAQELIFLRDFQPAMVGIGPFIPHCDTPFCREQSGAVELTLFMLSLIRLTLHKVLLPATTALGTIDGSGREKGILAGANVVMPNLSPVSVRKKYSLYDNKICTGDEAAQCIECMKRRMNSIGFNIVTHRGDSKMDK